jgi:hypothetical protein
MRVADWECEECEAALDDYLDAIIKWHPSYSSLTREEAAGRIADNLRSMPGQTFIERVVLIWRYSVELRARVLELEAHRRAA